MSVEEKLQLMVTLDDAWNTQDWYNPYKILFGQGDYTCSACREGEWDHDQ